MQLNCPHCRQSNSIPDHYADRQVRCLGCGQEFTARPPEPTPNVIHAARPVQPAPAAASPRGPRGDVFVWSALVLAFVIGGLLLNELALGLSLAVLCLGFGSVCYYLARILHRLERLQKL